MMDAWFDQSLDEVIEKSRDLLENTNFPTVREWREPGGKVLGHFQVYFLGA